MRKELGALVVAAALFAGCTSSADADFFNNAKYGVRVTEGSEVLDCYSNVRPTIEYSKPDPKITGQDFKCKIIQAMSAMDNFSFDSNSPISIFVDDLRPIRGDVNEIPSN